jgi:hypothetical protein
MPTHSQWDYITFLARRHQQTRASTQQRPRYDWAATFGDEQWDGWQEILDHLGKQGWEIISVVVEDQSENSVATSGRAEAYRFFCKRPTSATPPPGQPLS